MTRLALLAALLMPALMPTLAGAEAPYAGLDTRPIAALSDAEIADLRAGRGMGFALPAELNGYPSPRHVLDLADTLALDPDQRAAVEAVFAAMKAGAQALGPRVIEAEAALDRLFAEGTADPASVRAATAEAAAARADLRAVHLEAHLATLPILTRHQRHLYAEARGYGASHGHGDKHGHKHGHGAH